MVENEQHRALVVLFPDTRTTGGLAKYSDEYTPLLAGDYRKMSQELLGEYRDNGYKRIAAVYKDTTEETFSYLFDHSQFDEIIAWDKNFDEILGLAFRPAYAEFMESIGKRLASSYAEIVVGGYHANDCVLNFAHHLSDSGLDASVDLKLTDEASFLIVSHVVRRMLTGSMLEETISEDDRIWETKRMRYPFPNVR